MPVMKQKSIQPARNIPYADGILMYNPSTTVTIAANDLVRVDASAPSGQCLNLNTTVNAGSAANGAVPLFITKHSIPPQKYGVVLPWAILTASAAAPLNSGAISAGAPVYLQDDGTFGASVGTVDRVVGVCLVDVVLTDGIATAGTIFVDLRIGGVVTLS